MTDMIQIQNEEVLALEDHDERKVAGRHYRTMMGKFIALNEFKEALEELR